MVANLQVIGCCRELIPESCPIDHQAATLHLPNLSSQWHVIEVFAFRNVDRKLDRVATAPDELELTRRSDDVGIAGASILLASMMDEDILGDDDRDLVRLLELTLHLSELTVADIADAVVLG